MTAYRGNVAAFDKVTEWRVRDQDVGPVSIDEARQVFACDPEDPMIGALFPVSAQHADWILSKPVYSFDFGRFNYYFELRRPRVPIE